MTDLRYAAIGAHLHREDVDGIDGVSAFEIGTLFLSAAPFQAAEGLASRDVVLRVADLRRQLSGRQTFVAIRYGLSVSSAADALAKCAPHLPVWERVLREYRGLCEMTVKVATGTPVPRPDRKDFGSGKDYLVALRQARDGRSAPADVRAAIERAFTKSATRARWNERDDGATELALLVRRDAVDALRTAAMTLKENLASVPFLLSGPWPLEVFADGE